VYAVAFARDGHTLATASVDQTVLLWDLSGLQKIQSNPIGRACSLTGRGLNADEWGVVAPDVPYVDSCST
jgi:WD40 repeat protein